MQIFRCFFGCVFDNFAYDIVTARGQPKGFRVAFSCNIVDDGPRIENLCISEIIAVVPFARFLIFIGIIIIRQKLSYFIFSKTEILTVFVVENRIDF